MIRKIKESLLIIRKLKNWPVYFLDYFRLIKNKKIVYFLRNGIKILVRAGTQDYIPFKEIMIDNEYTPKGFEIEKNNVVLDIGAHIGIFSVFASAHASKVYSFEPAGDNFKILVENVNINKIKNVVCLNKAVSGKTGKRDFFINSNNSGGHSFYDLSFYKEGRFHETTTETVSLEDFIKSNNVSKIDFVKIDCEGGEYDILFSCPKYVLDKIGKISMEYHDIDSVKSSKSLGSFLEKNGFKVKIESGRHNYIFAERV